MNPIAETSSTLVNLSMEQLLTRFPGARRTLFQLHHIGGCSSCGFSLSETLEQICQRKGDLNPEAVLKEIQEGHERDEHLLISPRDLHDRLGDESLRVLDLRTREEFDAVSIPGSTLLTQELFQQAMHWSKDSDLVLVDHSGTRVLDAAAYFAGHGFTSVKGLRGGIDAYATEADTALPRYTVEAV